MNRNLVYSAVAIFMMTSATPNMSRAGENDLGSNISAADIEQLIVDTIKKNPDLIYQMYQKGLLINTEPVLHGEENGLADQIDMLSEENVQRLYANNLDPSHGPENPRAYIIEFFDYDCVICKQSSPIFNEYIKNNPDIKYIYKEVPVLSEQSKQASLVSLAISDIDMNAYKKYKTYLLEHPKSVNETRIREAIEYSGVDSKKLNDTLKEKGREYYIILQQNEELAYQVQNLSIPFFVVNGIVVEGYPKMEHLDEALKRSSISDVQKILSR